jgi:hypothetical protein
MAWELLLSSDFGLMSLGVIVFVILIAIFMAKMYTSKMNEGSK